MKSKLSRVTYPYITSSRNREFLYKCRTYLPYFLLKVVTINQYYVVCQIKSLFISISLSCFPSLTALFWNFRHLKNILFTLPYFQCESYKSVYKPLHMCNVRSATFGVLLFVLWLWMVMVVPFRIHDGFKRSRRRWSEHLVIVTITSYSSIRFLLGRD
jgi:hypothetical protein